MIMVSEMRLNKWKVTAVAMGTNMNTLFPLSNPVHELPSLSIEEALNRPLSQYSRADLVTSVRALTIK